MDVRKNPEKIGENANCPSSVAILWNKSRHNCLKWCLYNCWMIQITLSPPRSATGPPPRAVVFVTHLTSHGLKLWNISIRPGGESISNASQFSIQMFSEFKHTYKYQLVILILLEIMSKYFAQVMSLFCVILMWKCWQNWHFLSKQFRQLLIE